MIGVRERKPERGGRMKVSLCDDEVTNLFTHTHTHTHTHTLIHKGTVTDEPHTHTHTHTRSQVINATNFIPLPQTTAIWLLWAVIKEVYMTMSA